MVAESAVSYVDSLAHKNSEALSWLPRVAYERADEEGRLILQRYNGWPCGYLLHGPIRGLEPVHVWQCCIQADARRLGSASVALGELIRRARSGRASEIRLRCAVDLEANQFWLASGFSLLGVVPGGGRRGRLIACYQMPVMVEDLFAFGSVSCPELPSI